MAKIDKIIRKEIEKDLISNFTSTELKEDWCKSIIPILEKNRLRSYRASRLAIMSYKMSKSKIRRNYLLGEKLKELGIIKN